MRTLRLSKSSASMLSQIVPPALNDAWANAHDLLGELPASYEQACKHEVGDTLADFLVIDLFETHDGEQLADERVAAAAMLRIVDTVIEELSKYQSELVKLQKR